MAEQGGNAGGKHTAPPAPLPDFTHSSLPFPPPKPPVIHPILDNKKKPNPFAPKVPKNRVEKPKTSEPEEKKQLPVQSLPVTSQITETSSVPVQVSDDIVQKSQPETLELQEEKSNAEAHLSEEKIIKPKQNTEVEVKQKVHQNPREERAPVHADHFEQISKEIPDEPTHIKAEPVSVEPEQIKEKNIEQEHSHQLKSDQQVEKQPEFITNETEPQNEQQSETNLLVNGGDRVDMSGGLMGWLSKTMTESKILSDVANKARYGMEQVIITLDPGMKGFLARDGVVDLYTAVEDHTQIRAVQEGFEKVFANVLVRNVPAAKGNLPETVYGSAYSLEICRQRADRIIQSRLVPADAVVLVFQPFIFHLDDKLYASNRLLLKWNGNEFDSVSQLLDVDLSLFEVLKARSTMEGMPSNDYPITLSTASQEIYAIKEESWTGPPPPYNFADLLIPAASLVALNFMNSTMKSNK